MKACRMRSIIPSTLLLAVATLSAAQPRQAVRPASPRQAIYEAEDSRAPDAASLAVLTGALKSPQAATRRAALRALGRLERPECGPAIASLLGDPDAAVREEAADALGQSLHAAKAPRPGSTATDPGSTFIIAAGNLLSARLDAERDAAVRGALARTIGRLAYRDPASIAASEKALLSTLGPAAVLDQASLPAVLGAVQGAESLLRLQARVSTPGADLIGRLQALVAVPPSTAWEAAILESAAQVRRLALAALTAANRLDEATLTSAAADPDDQVRRLALSGFGGRVPPAIPATVVERLVRGGLGDRAGMVRLEALRAYGRLFLAADPEPVLAAVRDAWPHAALLAVDLLGQVPASAKDEASSLLESLARSLSPEGKPVEGVPVSRTWHAAAHAVVALARLGPDKARPLLLSFATSPDWPVRMYAARTAALLKDETALRRLGDDAHDNVREAALAGLSALIGREADPLLVAALARPDYQLVQTAARARLTMASGGFIELEFFTDEAPATVGRFARLARAGYYDGLTFHRIVPNFVVQGGSPGANEITGDGPYMRDEVGPVSHARGTLGISTRGRDTGDAQIFLNMVDNPRLDHDYTVFARIAAGLDVADAILECDVIAKVEILPRSGRS